MVSVGWVVVFEKDLGAGVDGVGVEGFHEGGLAVSVFCGWGEGPGWRSFLAKKVLILY